MTVSSFSSHHTAAGSKFNPKGDCSDLRSTITPKLCSGLWTDMKDLGSFVLRMQPRLNWSPLLFRSPVEPAPSPQVTPVNTFLSNSLATDLEGLSLSDTVLSPAVSVLAFF